MFQPKSQELKINFFLLGLIGNGSQRIMHNTTSGPLKCMFNICVKINFLNTIININKLSLDSLQYYV